jgi:negative regulator of genetic competence, sporulation and motility
MVIHATMYDVDQCFYLVVHDDQRSNDQWLF